MSFEQDSHPRGLLSPYLDGELPHQARSDVEAHLASCDPCRTILQDLRALASAASGEVPPPVPADLRARIRLALETRPAAGKVGERWWVGWHRLGLAAAAVFLVLGLWVMRGEIAPPRAPAVLQTGRSNQPEVADSSAIDVRETPPAAKPQVPEPTAGGSSGDLVGEERLRQEQGEPLGAVVRESGPESARKIEEMAQAPAAPSSRTEPSRAPSDAPEKDRAARRAMAAPAAPPGRTILLDLPAYRIAVSEQGMITLSAEGYSCSVRREGPSVDPDIAALFTLASSADSEAEDSGTSGTSGGAPALRMIEAPAEARGFSAKETSLGVPASEEIRARLKTLLQSRYLALMEDRCGPAPQAVHAP